MSVRRTIIDNIPLWRLITFPCPKGCLYSRYRKKPFLQIALSPLDRDYVQFLWFKDFNDIITGNIHMKEICSYRLCRVLFGVTSSSFLLSATLITHAERYIDNDPNFVRKLISSLHVDDLITGADCINTALDFYQKAKYRLQDAGFNLRKFESNRKELENLINEQNFQPLSTTKVLDLNWNKENDIITFDLSKLTDTKTTPTKREILRLIASIFDPLSIISPVMVRCKIFFEELCLSKIGWDTKLEVNLLIVWQIIIDDFRFSQNIVIPRWYINHCNSPVLDISLNGFSDASLNAYGCCLFLLYSFVDKQHHCLLITAKSRIAQVKKNTISRLELRAAFY